MIREIMFSTAASGGVDDVSMIASKSSSSLSLKNFACFFSSLFSLTSGMLLERHLSLRTPSGACT